MKALTVYQPHASLIALGVKPIETRSWSTKYRGPLAIHAGAKRPRLTHLPPLHTHGSGRDRCRGGPDCWHWLVIDTITDPAFQGPLPQSKRVPKRAQAPTLFYPARGPHGRPHVEGTPATEQGTATYLPLGAVVATCELVDVVPIVAELTWDGTKVLHAENGYLRLCGPFDHCGPGWTDRNVSDQAPYGDFTPGRYAWILDKIQPVDPPVPCKGRQGLWEWNQ